MKNKCFVCVYVLGTFLYSNSFAQNLQFNRVINNVFDGNQIMQGIVPTNQIYKIVSAGCQNWESGVFLLALDTAGGTSFAPEVSIYSWNYTGTIVSDYYSSYSISFPFWIGANTGYRFRSAGLTSRCIISIIVYDNVP